MSRNVGTLVLLRHGESEWNAKNLFTGWVDVDLTEQGEAEARRGGELLREPGLLPDVVHTSVLRRAIRTAEPGAATPPTGTGSRCAASWRLNERHYGALQGKNKKQTLEQYGEEQFMLWRRSYDVPPPPIDRRRRVLPGRATRATPSLPDELLPRTECLKDVVGADAAVLVRRDRAGPAHGKTVLVAAHGNSLRALVKHLDGDLATRPSRRSTSRPASRCVYELDAGHPAPAHPRRGVPRPGGRRRGRRRGRQPGPLAPGCQEGQLAVRGDGRLPFPDRGCPYDLGQGDACGDGGSQRDGGFTFAKPLPRSSGPQPLDEAQHLGDLRHVRTFQ